MSEFPGGAVGAVLALYAAVMLVVVVTHAYRTQRLQTALLALRGERLVRGIPWPMDAPAGPFITVDVNHLTSDPEHPIAAIFGHVSAAEQQYLCAELVARYVKRTDWDIDHDGPGPFGVPTAEHVRRLAYDLHPAALEAINGRLVLEQPDPETVMVYDPATGWRHVTRIPPYTAEPDREATVTHAMEIAPENALRFITQQVTETVEWVPTPRTRTQTRAGTGGEADA